MLHAKTLHALFGMLVLFGPSPSIHDDTLKYTSGRQGSEKVQLARVYSIARIWLLRPFLLVESPSVRWYLGEAETKTQPCCVVLFPFQETWRSEDCRCQVVQLPCIAKSPKTLQIKHANPWPPNKALGSVKWVVFVESFQRGAQRNTTVACVGNEQEMH
jgi:hypothetical protein